MSAPLVHVPAAMTNREIARMLPAPTIHVGLAFVKLARAGNGHAPCALFTRFEVRRLDRLASQGLVRFTRFDGARYVEITAEGWCCYQGGIDLLALEAEGLIERPHACTVGEVLP